MYILYIYTHHSEKYQKVYAYITKYTFMLYTK